jgi:hypothetical protein
MFFNDIHSHRLSTRHKLKFWPNFSGSPSRFGQSPLQQNEAIIRTSSHRPKHLYIYDTNRSHNVGYNALPQEPAHEKNSFFKHPKFTCSGIKRSKLHNGITGNVAKLYRNNNHKQNTRRYSCFLNRGSWNLTV